MIQPQTVSEKLLFNTVRLETNKGTGTGFFFHFLCEDKGSCCPGIITNRHVVEENPQQEVRFFLHLKEESDLKPTNESVGIAYKADWICHPNLDLCFAPTNPLIQKFKTQTQKEIYYTPLDEGFIWDDSKLEELQAVEDILMVGYPIGLFDQQNNLPLLRRGITASHPSIDFNGESIGTIDCACFPGSSGSPILLFNDNGYRDKKGTNHIGARRYALLGVLFGGPIFDAEGKITIKEIPTQQNIVTNTPLMINIGYYIKAKEILRLKEEVLRTLVN